MREGLGPLPSQGITVTTERTASDRAVASGSFARSVGYGKATCTWKAGDIYLDPAPRTYDAAQRAAGADDAAAARVARNPNVIAANALAAHCFADIDAALRAGVAGGIWRIPRTQKATIRAIELHDAAIEHLRVALDSAYAEDKRNPAPQKLITLEDEKTYGRDLIDLAKRAATEVKDLELNALWQEYLAQSAAIGGAIARAPAIPSFTKLITSEQEQAYGDELIDVVKRAAREAMDPELNALRQELLSQFAALGANDARGSPSLPPTKLITPEDEQAYGTDLIDLFKRAAREDAVLGVNKIRQQLLSQFAEFRPDIARDYGPASREESTQDVSVLNNFAFGKFKLDEKVDDLTELVEFSPAKYAIMIRRFKGEQNYDAPPINFLGRPWQLMLSTVHGQICKIAVNISLSNEREANPIATEALQYCKERLGSPSEQQTGLFIWDTKDGNVVLHTAEGAEGFLIAIYLTSRAIREFELL